MPKKNEAASAANECCPKCGYCPHCGRSNQPTFVPYYPVYPWWGVTPPQTARPYRQWYGTVSVTGQANQISGAPFTQTWNSGTSGGQNYA